MAQFIPSIPNQGRTLKPKITAKKSAVKKGTLHPSLKAVERVTGVSLSGKPVVSSAVPAPPSISEEDTTEEGTTEETTTEGPSYVKYGLVAAAAVGIGVLIWRMRR